MYITICIAIGVFLGVLIAVDLVNTKNRTYKFIKAFLYFSVHVLLFFDKDIIGKEILAAHPEWRLIVDAAFIGGILLACTWFYFFDVRKINAELKAVNCRERITLLQFISHSLIVIEEKVAMLKEKAEAAKAVKEADVQSIMDSFIKGTELAAFEIDIARAIDSVRDAEDFVGLAFTTLQNKFFNQHDARINFRRWDGKNMVSEFSTRQDITPGPVPLKKNTMISEAFRLKFPLLYSQNKHLHYCTKNNSIGNVYVNYVVIPLLTDAIEKPLSSVDIDARDEAASRRLEALHRLGVFGKLRLVILEKFANIVNDADTPQTDEYKPEIKPI